VGETLVLPLPLPSSVNVYAPLFIFIEDKGVPPDTERFVDDPLHIEAVPVSVAIGSALTVTVALPVTG